MNISSVILWLSFGLFILFPAYILGITRVFIWADDKFFSLPAFVRFLIAWLLSVVSHMTGLTIIIGIIEIFRQWYRYRKRKRQLSTDTDNASIWQEACKNDRRKLVYAYLIWPFHEVLLDYKMLSGVYKQIYPAFSNYTLLVIASFTIILGDFMLMIVPTSIRFLIIRRKLSYGTEICGYLVVSLFISLYANLFTTGYMVSSLGIMYTFAAYCILSYQSSEYSEEWYSVKINPILLMAVGLSCISLFSWITINGEQYLSMNKVFRIDNEGQYIPIREAIVITCMWLISKEKATTKEPEQTYKTPHSNDTSGQTMYRNQPPEPTHSETSQEPEQPQPPRAETPDIADTLIDIGLAHIGRTTALDNPYITPEQTQARHNAERPFLKLLSERYTDAQTRKALSHHFMLYKEVTLFMIFASVLRNDKPLHTKVQRKLKIRLSLGLPSKVIVKCNDYRRKLSEKFYESYTRTKDLAGTLDYTFWSVLPERIKGEDFADLVGNGYLMQIFNYTREAIAQKYNNLTKEN